MRQEPTVYSEAFKKCLDFHGHMCPGLSIGYKAARAGLDWLKENRAGDEEIVAIIETDACSADAVQVVTGCTFGKGNLIYKDHGKMVLTLLSRNSGHGVRVATRPDAFPRDENHRSLMQKVMKGDASDEEKSRFYEMHHKRSHDILDMADAHLFDIRAVEMKLPEKARMEPSELCARCGEATMRTKLETVDGEKICRGCAGL